KGGGCGSGFWSAFCGPVRLSWSPTVRRLDLTAEAQRTRSKTQRTLRYHEVLFMRLILLTLCLLVASPAADKIPFARLLEMARSQPGAAAFREALVASLGDAEVKKGSAVLGEGPDFIWALESDKTPAL